MFRKLLWGFVLCLPVTAVFADAPAPIPVQTFFAHAKVSAAKISPDGQYIAMAVANDKTGAEKNILVIISLADMKAKASTWLKGEQSVLDFWWANDERVLVATATQTGSLDSPSPDGEMYAINVDGTKKMQLLPYQPQGHKQQSVQETVQYAGLIHLDPEKDSKHIVFQGFTQEGPGMYRQTPKAYQLDIYTGDVRKLAQGTEAQGGLTADNDGAIRITEGTDDDGNPQLFYRASGDTLEWKDLSKLAANDDPAFSEAHVWGFAPDNRQFYWVGRTKYSTLGLYLVDPDTLAMKPLFEDPEFDVFAVVGSFRTDGKVSAVMVQTMPGLPAVHAIDPDDARVQALAQLYDAFPGQNVVITSYTRSHDKMVVATYSDRDPGQFYLYDAKAGQVRQLFSVKPEIDPAKMASMMPITVTARDGVVMHGYLTLPPGGGKDLPLIVNPHGGPHNGSRDEWGFNPEVQLFASRGYAVLQLNFRGSGGYGMKFQDLGYRHWSSTMQDDLADGVAWTVKQGYVDPKRVCIYGASYGGYAAFENPIRYPDLYKCAFGYVGAYDLTILGVHGDIAHAAGGSHGIDVYLGTDMEERKRESPAYNADKLKVPLMIAYGGADKRVVPEHAKTMMDALDKVHKDYGTPIYYANEAHGFRKEDHNLDLYTQMLAFFDKYIGPNAGKPATVPAAAKAP